MVLVLTADVKEENTTKAFKVFSLPLLKCFHLCEVCVTDPWALYGIWDCVSNTH